MTEEKSVITLLEYIEHMIYSDRYYRNVYPEAHSGGMIISNTSSITINIDRSNNRPTLRNIGRVSGHKNSILSFCRMERSTYEQIPARTETPLATWKL